ncbi:MAG: amidohydrolase family protein [Candidatus Acidiferrales bacterium]
MTRTKTPAGISLLFFVSSLLAPQLAAQQQPPNLILLNGQIFTSDAAHPYVQALAISGERILATGDSAKVKALAGPHTRQIDLAGRTVIPGINDAHDHIGLDPPHAVHLDLKTIDPTWNQLKDAIATAAAKAPKGTFILADIGPITFHDTSVARIALDLVAPENPVILTTLTGHAAILNSMALAQAGIGKDQPDPLGGRYERSADGMLTGVVREYAVLQLSRNLALMPSDAEAIAQLRDLFAQCVKFGITSLQDMSDALPPDRAVKLFEATPTPIRIRIMRMPGTTPAGRDTLEGRSVPRHPSPLITVSGTKWMLDGVPLENTFTPRDVPSMPAGETLDYGARHLPLTFSEKEMDAMLQESLADGDQMMFHVSGYLSAAAMLNTMQATGGKKVWDGKRVRFEHGDGLFPDLIPRAKDFGIVVVQNPTHFDAGLLFGPTPVTYKEVQPFRTLLAAGIPVALGSDGPLNPYLNIMLATIDPGRPTEAITREQAVTAYTLTSAYAEFAEKDKGSLEVGKLADLAVLSQNIFQVPVGDLPKTESVLTIVGGKIVFDSGALPH